MTHIHRLRHLATLILVAWLAACTQVSDPVPLQTIETLTGKWQQVDGPATVQFYEDETIKFVRPDQSPPFRVLTLLENMKDGVGFSIGDRWTKPVRIVLAEDGQHLTLVLPEKEEVRLHFTRSK